MTIVPQNFHVFVILPPTLSKSTLRMDMNMHELNSWVSSVEFPKSRA